MPIQPQRDSGRRQDEVEALWTGWWQSQGTDTRIHSPYITMELYWSHFGRVFPSQLAQSRNSPTYPGIWLQDDFGGCQVLKMPGIFIWTAQILPSKNICWIGGWQYSFCMWDQKLKDSFFALFAYGILIKVKSRSHLNFSACRNKDRASGRMLSTVCPCRQALYH